MKINSKILFVVTCGVILGFGQPTGAVTLVLNGDFEETVTGPDKQLGYAFDPQTYKTDATHWNNNAVVQIKPGEPLWGYNFVFSPGIASTTGAANQYGPADPLIFWSPSNGGLGTEEIPASSPNGGNFLAADGAFGQGTITQMISGLTTGQDYEVSFWWAAAQQKGYEGDTTSQWKVSLGAESQFTEVIALPSKSFSGWIKKSLTFTADSASPILSFLAVGTPDGVPPFALLDGVSIQAIPEPSSVLIGGIFVCGVLLRRSRRTHHA